PGATPITGAGLERETQPGGKPGLEQSGAAFAAVAPSSATERNGRARRGCIKGLPGQFFGSRGAGPFRSAHGTTDQRRPRWSRRPDMEDREIRTALDRHWAASDANDFEEEHRIYREDAVLEYPQSGERVRGRLQIQLSRTAQPNRKRF